MRLYLRNKASGEIRDVEADSAEFRELVKEVTSNGLPMWEQTSYPHADAVKERATYGELQEEDLGWEHQDELRPEALKLDAQGVAPEANPHLALTPGEIEAGLTPEQKLQDLRDQYDSQVVGRRQEVFDKAADTIADERKERPAAQAAQGQLARAGGSDDRVNVPSVDASEQEKGSKKSSGSKQPASAGASQGGGDS